VPFLREGFLVPARIAESEEARATVSFESRSEGEEEEEAMLVILLHRGPDFMKDGKTEWLKGRDYESANWDVFSTSKKDTAEELGLYDMSECPHVARFLKFNPRLRYVGSEDNLHYSPNAPPKGKGSSEV
jgi:hypothetical protein